MTRAGRVLGLNAFHGDAAAAVLSAGRLVAGVEEERFTRVKHWAGFPERAIRHCLTEIGNGSLDSVEMIAVSRQPRAYLWRKAALTLLTLVTMAVVVPLQFLFHVAVIQPYSLMHLPLLYLFGGVLLQVLVFVSLYAWAMSWQTPERAR